MRGDMKKTQSKTSDDSVHKVHQSKNKKPFFGSRSDSDRSFFSPAVIQPSLKIGAPDDPYEREADRVADAVVNSPAPVIQQQSIEEEEELQMKRQNMIIQSKCSECENEEKLQMNQESPQSGGYASNEISKSIRNGGGGNRLPSTINSEMSQKIGADFSDVNIHTGSGAVRMNRELGARAFTYNKDIYFNSGEYRPETSEGKRLLAHELTHVVQQNGAFLSRSSQSIQGNVSEKRIQGGFFDDVWEGVKSAGKAVGEGIVSGVEAVAGAAGKVWDKATNFLEGAADWALEGIKSLSSTVVNWLSTAGRKVWEAIEFLGSKAWAGIKWLGQFLWEKLVLIGENVWSFLSNIPVRLWRVIVQGWEGIKGVINWAWSGLKSASGYVWDGLTSVFDWLGEGVEGAMEWLLDGIASGYQWAVDFIRDPSLTKLFEAFTGALSWAWDGLKGFAKWGWEGIKGAAIWIGKGLKGFGSWLWEGIVSGAKWAGELLLYVLDLVGTAEALQIIWGLVFSMRKLTPAEREASEEVHPPGMIPYDLIRIDDNSVISMIGGAAVTTFHVLHYPKGGLSIDVVVHELTHVAQYENVGSVYIPQALHAQAKYGRTGGVGSGSAYDYERTGSLASLRAGGKKFKDFNRESQAELVQDFYLCKINNRSSYQSVCADMIPFIKEMERGEF